MDISKQVVSLELSQRLKALGVKAKSLFYWRSLDGKIFFMPDSTPPDADDNGNPIYPAYTSSELGELLPVGCYCGKDKDDYYCGFNDEYLIDENPELVHKFDENNIEIEEAWRNAKTEVEAKSLVLEYLLEQGLLKI